MLNTTTFSPKTEIRTPATGIIQRSNVKSFFLRFHHNSTFANKIFEPEPKYKEKDVAILQMLLIEDGYILAEVVNIADL